jgi:hypothetical protein
MSEDKSFAELVAEAPKAANADHVTLVGTLGKSDDPRKFEIILSDGSAHTLDVAAVKKHTVLGHSVGRTIVQIEIGRDSAPASAERSNQLTKPVASDGTGFLDHSIPSYDYKFVHTDALSDPHPTILENTLSQNFAVDPAPEHGLSTFVGNGAPFSLATAHQIAQQQVEALNAAALSGTRTYLTGYLWTADHHTIYRAAI